MASLKEHFLESITYIKKKNTEIYNQDKELVEELICSIHKWLDAFEGKGEYTGRFCIRHRQERHHIQGIAEAVKIFSEDYGKGFKEIIEHEARRHIYRDMKFIPEKEDYRNIWCGRM